MGGWGGGGVDGWHILKLSDQYLKYGTNIKTLGLTINIKVLGLSLNV